MPGAGSSSMCATPASSAAATRSAELALEISTRARIASRAPGGMSSDSRNSRAEGPAAGPRLPASAASARSASATAAASSSCVVPMPPLRVAPAVAHALVPEPEGEPVHQLADRSVPGKDELGAHLHDGAVRKPLRPDPAAHARARLQHDHLDAAARELVRRHQAGKPRPDDDGPQGPVPGATATASTATAPRSCTSTGFSSSSSSPFASRRSPAAAARRAAAATSSAGRPRPPVKSGGRAQGAERRLHPLGRGGQRHKRGVVQRLGPDAAGAHHEAGHHGVRAGGHEQLGAGRRHPLHQHGGTIDGERGEIAMRRPDSLLAAHAEDQGAHVRLVLQRRGAQLDRHVPAQLRQRNNRIVLAGNQATVDHRQGGGAKQLLGLVLGEPARAVGCGAWRCARGGGGAPAGCGGAAARAAAAISRRRAGSAGESARRLRRPARFGGRPPRARPRR